MPVERPNLPVRQRLGQLGRDAFALGWRSTAAIGVTSQIPGIEEPAVRIATATGAGVVNRVFRGIEHSSSVEGESRHPALLRDIESVLVFTNVIAASMLLHSEMEMAEKLIVTIGAATVELLLLYVARDPASHGEEPGG